MVIKFQLLITRPNAIPAAGACSAFNIAIINIEIPIANDADITKIVCSLGIRFNNIFVWTNWKKRNPTIKPIIYPPINLLGSDEYLCGIVNTINELAPKAVIIAARKHWSKYFNLLSLNFWSIILKLIIKDHLSFTDLK